MLLPLNQQEKKMITVFHERLDPDDEGGREGCVLKTEDPHVNSPLLHNL